MRRLLIVLMSCGLLAACERDELPPASRARPDIRLASDTTVSKGLVSGGSTLESILLDEGLSSDIVQSTIALVRTVFDPRRLRSLQPYSIEQSLEGELRRFEYEIDATSFLRVASVVGRAGEMHAEVVPIPATLVHDTVAGAIDEATPSLFQSIEAVGERPDLAIAMAQVFSGEIDFNSELQPGDRYAITFERFERDGRPPSYGVITAAEFQNDGRVIRAIRFTPSGGEPGYYDEQGRSLKRFFLRSPLKFEPRVTSGFSSRRMHPILHTARAHRGVDYGAPMGAEVVSIANGRVLSATTDATNGRMVQVRHGSGYVSQYLHLSSFGPGIRAGAAVSQGQMVGRVGATGLATGPHLHYGLLKNGVFVNPLNEHRNMPPGAPIAAADLTAFGLERDRALAAIAAPSESGDSPRNAAAAR